MSVSSTNPPHTQPSVATSGRCLNGRWPLIPASCSRLQMVSHDSNGCLYSGKGHRSFSSDVDVEGVATPMID
ncbi:hypothetical protein TNCV_469271 [Trichonephila clavipes]|nr:hypothetical protein TNCV_469271 [Trichonephila clavipes]